MSSVYDLRTLTSPAEGSSVKFPAAPYANAASYFDAYAEEISRTAKTIDPAMLDRAAVILLEAYTRGAPIFSCGNRGSASIANHMQCDHVKGVRTTTDLSPHVLSLSTNVELLTAIASDMGTRTSSSINFSPIPGRATCSWPSRRQVVRPTSCGRSPGLVAMACTLLRSPASTEAPPSRRPRSTFMSTARTTGSARTCIRPSCIPWPSTYANRG